jgi:hypothetical protein
MTIKSEYDGNTGLFDAYENILMTLSEHTFTENPFPVTPFVLKDAGKHIDML